MKSIAVIGAGSWGTAIALHLAANKHRTYLWDRDLQRLTAMQKFRYNPKYLSQYKFPDNVIINLSLAETIANCVDVFIAVPSHNFETCLRESKPYLTDQHRICWGSKGLVNGKLLHHVAKEILANEIPLAILSGPSFAFE